jgi:CrcB protein
MTAALFVLFAAAGAALRFQAGRLGLGWFTTLALNVVGAFGLGVIVAQDPSSSMLTVAGTGFFGSLTTFSTFALDVSDASAQRRIGMIVATVGLGLAAAAAGFASG